MSNSNAHANCLQSTEDLQRRFHQCRYYAQDGCSESTRLTCTTRDTTYARPPGSTLFHSKRILPTLDMTSTQTLKSLLQVHKVVAQNDRTKPAHYLVYDRAVRCIRPPAHDALDGMTIRQYGSVEVV